jgi:hypothetical protein
VSRPLSRDGARQQAHTPVRRTVGRTHSRSLAPKVRTRLPSSPFVSRPKPGPPAEKAPPQPAPRCLHRVGRVFWTDQTLATGTPHRPCCTTPAAHDVYSALRQTPGGANSCTSCSPLPHSSHWRRAAASDRGDERRTLSPCVSTAVRARRTSLVNSDLHVANLARVTAAAFHSIFACSGPSLGERQGASRGRRRSTLPPHVQATIRTTDCGAAPGEFVSVRPRVSTLAVCQTTTIPPPPVALRFDTVAYPPKVAHHSRRPVAHEMGQIMRCCRPAGCNIRPVPGGPGVVAFSTASAGGSRRRSARRVDIYHARARRARHCGYVARKRGMHDLGRCGKEDCVGAGEIIAGWSGPGARRGDREGWRSRRRGAEDGRVCGG